MALLEPSLYERQTPLPKRAYQLARSGACKDLDQISRRLAVEGYSNTTVNAYLRTQSISADLTCICQIADQR